MIYSGGSSSDTKHAPAILKRSKKTGNLQFTSYVVAKAVRMARIVCTDGDSDEDIRCGNLRPEHRNVFPTNTLSTTSDRTA
jgi:hypothetical protein